MNISIGHQHRKTKIIATVGPSSRSPEKLRALVRAGANVFRLNFSHGSAEEHLQSLSAIRAVSSELDMPVGVLQDLAGPKIRITNIPGDYISIGDSENIELGFAGTGSCQQNCSSSQRIFVETINPVQILKPGQHVLLADGLIELIAEVLKDGCVRCKVLKGGRIRSRVGIAFPDSAIDLPATTDKDLSDLEWGIENKVDFVAVSFVQNAQDILNLREVCKQKNSSIALVAKIERKTALENIDSIIEASDGVMVARGDLGLELPLEQVPLIQRRIIEKANYRGVPVIVATQMLHSMITSIRPTRAEVTDIAFAVMSGADAVMLSEETAIGEHPIESVEYLGKVARQAEESFIFEEYRPRLHDADRLTVPDAVAYAACAAAIKVNASAIIACTETGNSARLVAKYRPRQSLYGVSTSEATLQRMALFWGVIPFRALPTTTHSDELEMALRAVQLRENIPNGSRAVIIGGLSVSSPGSTSILEIREMRAA